MPEEPETSEPADPALCTSLPLSPPDVLSRAPDPSGSTEAPIRLIFSPQATIEHIDSQAQQLLGWDLEQTLSLSLGIFHPDDRVTVGGMLRRVRTAPSVEASADVRLVGHDEAWVEATVVVTNRLRDDDLRGLELLVYLDKLKPLEPSPTPEQTANELDPPQPTDIGILLRSGSSIIDLATGPVQGKLGCHPDELAGQHIWELLHADDEGEFTEALDAFEQLPVGAFRDYGALRFLDTDGNVRKFAVVVARRETGLVVRARDLGSDRGANPADDGEAAVVFLDETLSITYASDSFNELFGRPATGSVGLELLAAVHPTDRWYTEQRLSHPALDGEIHGFVRASPSSGHWRWFEVIGRNYLDDPTVNQIALQISEVTSEPPFAARQGTKGNKGTSGSAISDQRGAQRLGTFTRDQDGNVSFVNDVLLEMFGDAEALLASWPQLVEVGEDGMSETLEMQFGDAAPRFIRSRMRPIIGADGERTGDVAIVEDLTDLIESGDLPEDRPGDDDAAVLVLERHGGFRFVSAGITARTGADTGTDPLDFFTPKSAVLLRSEVWPAVEASGSWVGQLWVRTDDRGAVPFHAQFHAEPAVHVAGPAESTPEHPAEQQQVQHQEQDDPTLLMFASVVLTPLERANDGATHAVDDHLGVDPVTLLDNGAALKRRIERAIAKSVSNRTKVALALIEFDRPPAPEDLDEIAQQTAGRLSLACRHDEIPARIDDCTFAVLSQRMGDAIDIEHLTSRIADELAGPFHVGAANNDVAGREVAVEFSLGLAYSEDAGLTADELFTNADVGLRRARSRGRVRTAIVGEQHLAKLFQRRAVEAEFREALSSEQIDNAYQLLQPGSPSDGTHRFEALVRWTSPTIGQVIAADVVAMAADLGLATAVGHRVIDRALDFASTQQRLTRQQIEVNINVDLAQLGERGFVSRLDALLRLYNVPAARVGIEIPQAILLAPNDVIETVLPQLRDVGVRVIVDEATSRVFRGPLASVDEIKVERRLIEGVGRDPADTAQVASILTRAHEYRIGVTAVGVATGRQLDLLSDLGFDWLQGFLINRPQPGNEIVIASREVRDGSAGGSSDVTGAA